MTRVEEIQRIGDWNFLSMWSGKLIYFVCTLWKFGKLECVIKTSVISCEGKFQDNRKIWPSFIFYTRRPKIMRRVKRKFLFWDLDQDYWSILILKEWKKVTILNRNWQWNLWTSNYLAWKEVTQIFAIMIVWFGIFVEFEGRASLRPRRWIAPSRLGDRWQWSESGKNTANASHQNMEEWVLLKDFQWNSEEWGLESGNQATSYKTPTNCFRGHLKDVLHPAPHCIHYPYLRTFGRKTQKTLL